MSLKAGYNEPITEFTNKLYFLKKSVLEFLFISQLSLETESLSSSNHLLYFSPPTHFWTFLVLLEVINYPLPVY